MVTLGSGLTGLGNVQTAGEPPSGGGGGGSLPFDFTGTYFTFDIDTEGKLNITQIASTSGGDFDAHPNYSGDRYFSTPGVLGMTDKRTARYTIGGATPSGGTFERSTVDPDDGAAVDFMDYRRYLSYPSTLDWYDPVVGGATGPLGTVGWTMLDALGSGHAREFLRQSDGVLFNPCLFPTAAPHKLAAFVTTMNRRDTGAASPPNGSALGWRVGGPDSGYGIGVSAEIASMYAVLDSQNFGSAQATGHWDFYASGPALATGPKLALSVYSDHVAVPPGVLTVGGSPVAQAGVSATIDLLAAVGTSYTLSLPVVPGKKLVGAVGRFMWISRTGVATGNAQISVGNNGTFDNCITAAGGQMNIATINAAVADTITSISGGAFAVDMSTTALKVAVAQNPTGVTAATGKLIFTGVYI